MVNVIQMSGIKIYAPLSRLETGTQVDMCLELINTGFIYNFKLHCFPQIITKTVFDCISEIYNYVRSNNMLI
jgi:hypothetical protein